MPIEPGTYFNGVRDLKSLRAHCRIDETCGCWRYRGHCDPKQPPTVYLYLPNGKRAIRKGRRAAAIIARGAEIDSKLVAYPSPNCKWWDCLCPDHALVGTRKEACAAAAKRGAYHTQAARSAITVLNQSKRKISLQQQQELRDAQEPHAVLAARYGISKHRVKSIKQGAKFRATSVFEWRP